MEKPEKNQFVGKFYNSEELSTVMQLTRGTKLELPVIFGGFYGLRRSEIVGLRWSAIDFDNDVFYVNHTPSQHRQSMVRKPSSQKTEQNKIKRKGITAWCRLKKTAAWNQRTAERVQEEISAIL